jgi:hypothetical protein
MREDADYMEAFLASQQCYEREADGRGYQCELSANHTGPHECPVALASWVRARGYGGLRCA